MLVLTAANGYTGATLISSGTLQIGAGGAGGAAGSLSPNSTITNNGALAFNRVDTVTQGTDFDAAAITGSGSLTQAGAGVLVLNASNGYTGATLVSGGTLLLANSAAISGSTFDTSGAGRSVSARSPAPPSAACRAPATWRSRHNPRGRQLERGRQRASTTFSGGLSGSGSLTELGRGS